MSKVKRFSASFLAFFTVLVILVSSLDLQAFAVPEQNANPAPVFNTDEDSTFILANSNVQTGDQDYCPKTANISDEEEYNLNTDKQSNEALTMQAASQTEGDAMVYLTQKWLNQEYGSVSGFGSVVVNGQTGSDVVNGLLRALQHELGITKLANSFGPTTTSLYSQNLLYRQDGVTKRNFAILQAALWCKGYNPGYYLSEDPNTGIVSFQEVFNATVENAVIQLKEDAGLINPDGVVTVNVMKELMCMDSFKLLGSSYGGKEEVRAMQQKLNRNYEAYTGLNPCDGVYGRNTNIALIYAFQAVEGLPIGVANGSFGPTTKSLCPQIPYVISDTAAKSYQGTYYTNVQITAFTEFLQFALYINGFGDGNTDGVFGPATQQAINDFQKHYALPQSGKADTTTWMSLLISSGDTNRSALAADCVTILNAAKAQTLYDNGYRYVGRYLTGTYGGGISKAMTSVEANIILNAGLRFFPIYEQSSNTASYFTQEQGTSDAKAAIAAATALGIPRDTIIYFAVDFDATGVDITNNVIPYFSKLYEEMSASIYKTGIYGARNVCSRVAAAGYSCSSFVGDMSTGFSGNLGFKIPDDWAFSQFANLAGTNALGAGDGRIEIDKDAVSGCNQGVSHLDFGSIVPIDPDYIGVTAESGGTVSGSGYFAYGSTVTVTAKPDEGYVFSAWRENGYILYEIPATYAFTVSANRTLEAIFVPNDILRAVYNVTVEKNNLSTDINAPIAYTVTVRDRNGVPLQNIGVNVYEIYDNTGDTNTIPMTTDVNGIVSFTVTPEESFTLTIYVPGLIIDGYSYSAFESTERIIPLILGDINFDGSVTAVDALMALQAATGKISLTDLQKSAADVNKDGSVTAVDALLILQYATGKITHF